MTPAQRLREAVDLYDQLHADLAGFAKASSRLRNAAIAVLAELDQECAAPVTTFHGHAPKPEPVFTAHQLRYLASFFTGRTSDSARVTGQRMLDDAVRIEREG